MGGSMVRAYSHTPMVSNMKENSQRESFMGKESLLIQMEFDFFVAVLNY